MKVGYHYHFTQLSLIQIYTIRTLPFCCCITFTSQTCLILSSSHKSNLHTIKHPKQQRSANLSKPPSHPSPFPTRQTAIIKGSGNPRRQLPRPPPPNSASLLPPPRPPHKILPPALPNLPLTHRRQSPSRPASTTTRPACAA